MSQDYQHLTRDSRCQL